MTQRVAGAFRLFTAFGIDVHLHWSWFLLAAGYVYYQSATSAIFDQPYWHALVFLALFVIVTLHEMGHALACRSVGGTADTIVLWPLGGIAFVRPPARPGAVLWSIAAGPLVNLALIPPTLGAAILAANTPDPAALSDPRTFVLGVAAINIAILAFNLLPIYPLDGGQMLQAVLWFFIGRAKSLLVVAYVGLVGAGLIAGGAILVTDTLLFIIALFLAWQAWNGLRVAKALANAERGIWPR